MKATHNPKTPEQVRHLFFLFKQLGIKEELRENIVLSYTDGRVSNVADLSFIEAQSIIRRLKELTRTGTRQRSDTLDMDKKRKGLIKAIFRWYKLQGKEVTMEYVKATACRAANVDYFNEISSDALTRLYNEFCRKQQIQDTKSSTYFKINLN